MKRYKGEIRYRKSGRTAWKCDHYHRTVTEAGDCAADHMSEVVVLSIQPFELTIPKQPDHALRQKAVAQG